MFVHFLLYGWRIYPQRPAETYWGRIPDDPGFTSINCSRNEGKDEIYWDSVKTNLHC